MKKSRKLIILAIIIVVVVAGSAAAAVWVSVYQASVEQAKKEETQGLQKLPAEEKANDADKLAYEGDVEGGTAALDDAIKGTNDSYEKFVYYSRKATLLFNHGDLNGALEAAKKAHELEKTSDSAAFIGQIARDKGDKAMALEYYNRAVELIDPTDPFADEDKQYYQGIITELGSGQ